MTSLAKQMEQLKKQQEVLEQKIKHEEESKKKESFNIESLEELNKKDDETLKKYFTTDWKYRKECELTSNLTHTKHRFGIILEILKKQNLRIQELESKLITNNVLDTPLTIDTIIHDSTEEKKC